MWWLDALDPVFVDVFLWVYATLQAERALTNEEFAAWRAAQLTNTTLRLWQHLNTAFGDFQAETCCPPPPPQAVHTWVHAWLVANVFLPPMPAVVCAFQQACMPQVPVWRVKGACAGRTQHASTHNSVEPPLLGRTSAANRQLAVHAVRCQRLAHGALERVAALPRGVRGALVQLCMRSVRLGGGPR